MKNNYLQEMPREERPREKLLFRGAESLSTAELLAILLRTGTGSLPVLDLAQRILSLCPEGIGGLSVKNPRELMELPGIGEAKACEIAAAFALGRRAATQVKPKRPNPRTPEALASLFLEDMRRLPKEEIRVAAFNTKLEIIGITTISIGDLNHSLANPREVFREAVRMNAGAIVMVHNHPSGDPEPSQADIETSRLLAKNGSLLGIELIDSLVIGDGTYVSLREKGYFERK